MLSITVSFLIGCFKYSFKPIENKPHITWLFWCDILVEFFSGRQIQVIFCFRNVLFVCLSDCFFIQQFGLNKNSWRIKHISFHLNRNLASSEESRKDRIEYLLTFTEAYNILFRKKRSRTKGCPVLLSWQGDTFIIVRLIFLPVYERTSYKRKNIPQI